MAKRADRRPDTNALNASRPPADSPTPRGATARDNTARGNTARGNTARGGAARGVAARTTAPRGGAPRAADLERLRMSASGLDHLQANVFMCDRDLRIVYVNTSGMKTLRSLADEVQRAFGVDVNSLIGTSIHTFHKDPRRVERILGSPDMLPHSAEFSFAGTTLQTRINHVKDEAGEIIGYIVVWVDITRQRRLELDFAGQIAAIRRTQAVIEFELDGTIIDANDNFLRVMGYSLEEIKGRHHSMFVDAAYAASTDYRRIWSELNMGKEQSGRFRRLAKGGGHVWIQATYFPILDGAGKPFKVVKYATDIRGLKQIESALETSTHSLVGAAGNLTEVSQQMAANSEETAAQASVVSTAAEQVSRNVATVATAAEEMGASIKEIARNANDAARVATAAVKVAEKTNNTVAKLGDSSQEIGNVIKVITSIAQQTNLLALNATIEAARAGEAGKGFAVVANEVKELAKQTARATEDIGRRIEAIQADTKGAVDAIGQISGIIGQINDIQSTIASAVEEQTATTAEISRNVSEAALGSREIAENVAGIASAARNTTEAAAKTNTSAADLAKIGTELQRLVTKLQV
ncbi:MAG: methyl-accepting chemotaxis protein [Planctomycetota bacterium]